MAIQRRALLRALSVLTASAALPRQARAASAASSAWSKDMSSRARLLLGSSAASSLTRQGGIEIALDPGYKTYWRNPGDAGVPPVFNFENSRNIRKAEIAYPAPIGFSDGTGTSYGYKTGVIFPLAFELESADRPAALVCALDYAVCEKICIPARAALSLEIGLAGLASPFEPALAAARLLVPLRVPMGETARGLAILAAAWTGADEKSFTVRVTAPSGPAPALFADAPSLWAFETKSFEPQPGGGVFTVDVVDRPRGTAPVFPKLSLTLVAESQSIEIETSLDAIKPRP